jgi:hypothetical protein
MHLLVFCAADSRLAFRLSTRLYCGYHCLGQVRELLKVVGTAAVDWGAYMTVLIVVASAAPVVVMIGPREICLHSHPAERQGRQKQCCDLGAEVFCTANINVFLRILFFSFLLYEPCFL